MNAMAPPRVGGDLRVEGGGHQIALFHRHDNLLHRHLRRLLRRQHVLCQHLHRGPRGQDGGRADEDGAERPVLVPRDLARQRGLESGTYTSPLLSST
jgi:hypothetical protein